MLFSLKGRTALVTGAGQGMGFGIAEALAEQGAVVVINDIDAERAAAAAARLRQKGYAAVGMGCDVCERSSIDQMLLQVAELGALDIVVNNAGLPAGWQGDNLRFIDSQPANWQRYVELNLYGVMHMTQAVLTVMRERRHGRIVTISSESWRMGTDMGLAAYAASKAAAIGFMRQIAAENGAYGITANCLSLGTMNNWEGSEQLAAKINPIPRAGSPRDVGAACAFLVSDEASWLTGQVLPLNGGVLMA
ncbi:SDR family NAD(P)-dependent oxidoreductase [Craterilacuibacter sp. RT1T]|uniref:SDR family NAD(P)-dependent oxidoreductase n=1 Tax=Craterilacuibacter sp. RT1T TaxID=2942211 RepID=UPI0020BF68B1|nr:SDR family NAD(P)-dependent oxidoreductase [Craterilacuibacter sp. RT1T]MCL6262993.1 SDR family oxidoreductase [Craterilacuibacter sp. RT1T]